MSNTNDDVDIKEADVSFDDEDYVEGEDENNDDSEDDDDLSFDEDNDDDIDDDTDDDIDDDIDDDAPVVKEEKAKDTVVNVAVNRGGSKSYNIKVVKQDNEKERSRSSKGTEKSSIDKKTSPLIIVMITIAAVLAIVALMVSSSSSTTSLMALNGTVIDISITHSMVTREALVNAARRDSVKLQTMLRLKPESVMDADDNGWNILHEASRAGNTECVKVILDTVDSSTEYDTETYLNARTARNGPNALYFAKGFDHHDIVALLESRGGVLLKQESMPKKETNTEDESESEQIAAEDKESNEVDDVVDIVDTKANEKEIKKVPYADAASACHTNPQFLKEILTMQPEYLDHVDDNGWTLLHEASRGGNLDSVSIILSMKDDLDYINKENNKGANALYLAHVSGNEAVIDMLKSKGAVNSKEEKSVPVSNEESVEEETFEEETVEEETVEEETYTQVDAVVASQRDPTHLQKILQKNPEFATTPDKNGWILLHEASRAGHVECVEVLLQFMKNKDDINRKTSTGSTALTYAKKKGHTKIIELLLSSGATDVTERSEL